MPANVEPEVSAKKKGARGHSFGVNKMANCEAAGPEQVQGYWFNKTDRNTFYIVKRPARLCSFRKRPKQTVRRRTFLKQKDTAKLTQANNSLLPAYSLFVSS